MDLAGAGPRRAFERRIDGRHRLHQRLHRAVERRGGCLVGVFDLAGQGRFEQVVQHALVLRVQGLEGHAVLDQEADAGRVEQRGGGARHHQRHRHAEVGVHRP